MVSRQSRIFGPVDRIFGWEMTEAGAITPNQGAIADNRLIFGDSQGRFGFQAEPNIRTDWPNIRLRDDRYEKNSALRAEPYRYRPLQIGEACLGPDTARG